MPTSVIEHIRRVVGDGLRDGELLGRYVDRRDEAALAALVNRHGPMVWGVCRRHLSHHDAEDAFQATFIVLVRKASSIVQREAVGNWLYGVAHQTALQARRSAARRRAREVQVTEMPDAEAPQERWADLQPLLDEELSRLPDHYRTVIVLSDLEGRTRKEVAAQLGCPEGTVASRLVRARSMLAKRLTQRGVALSGGALAVVMSQGSGAAGVPVDEGGQGGLVAPIDVTTEQLAVAKPVTHHPANVLDHARRHVPPSISYLPQEAELIHDFSRHAPAPAPTRVHIRVSRRKRACEAPREVLEVATRTTSRHSCWQCRVPQL